MSGLGTKIPSPIFTVSRDVTNNVLRDVQRMFGLFQACFLTSSVLFNYMHK